jgi:hypothetical protein
MDQPVRMGPVPGRRIPHGRRSADPREESPVNTMLRTRFKHGLLSLVSSLTGRHAVLLPAEARHEESILDLRAPYRVEGQTLTVELREQCRGRITATLLAYVGHFPTKTVWKSSSCDYAGPCEMTLDLTSGIVLLADREWDRVPLPRAT